MLIIVGFLIVIISVVGGYVLSHGKLGALWQPYELMIIGGAALGAFLVSTPAKIVKATFVDILGAFKGPRYKSDDYRATLSLIYELLNKARRDGFMALEDHVEKPADSAIFGNYPKVLSDHHLLDFITDCLRLMIGSNIEPHELEPLLELELEKHHHEAMAPAHALSKVSDGLPGFGIVAAVLGIVITMGSIGGPIEEIGHHVGAALVGTFLGILLAYGFVAPLSAAMEARAEQDSRIFESVKTALLACLRGYNPKIALEFARKTLPSNVRPSFSDFETHLKTIK
ncbi:flagellar motor stator protein MotA [Xanthomonas graminis]|jgi:chemotaxis protein MotA|uniref:Flagellar motor protein MotA n=1 Tax=Xanthomonas graminis pv. graminis TaxID=134874 RepID=A0A1M4IRJ7_9XANT|nr:flagellar motor stator protein MotA [Xanthomonas translucens]EKU25755.1 Flagellar motor component MotA [Xanthomonas translucens pv. graminis ART-Xtg29]OAX63072.1 flagellar motor stator protein MotA [Xanthomonas translucens pv. graminis]UKE54893.1 flagellar motor stator protein MotA [Xanthomonas translucens pv. graminis]WIH09264.1 flagellar motor stator protein MotA [Xanthomonas translucens pv. graminis]WIH12571.1 flagellar motor stator protein MotA [Xanthomonas translucens pv. graminis]